MTDKKLGLIGELEDDEYLDLRSGEYRYIVDKIKTTLADILVELDEKINERKDSAIRGDDFDKGIVKGAEWFKRLINSKMGGSGE